MIRHTVAFNCFLKLQSSTFTLHSPNIHYDYEQKLLDFLVVKSPSSTLNTSNAD